MAENEALMRRWFPLVEVTDGTRGGDRLMATLVTALLALALLALALPAVAGAQALSADARAKAEQLWNRYVSLEAAFDPAVADLYADDALIRNRRTYPTGEVREATVPAPQYKLLVRQAIPLAQAKNDTSRYTGCTYAAEGARVRIICNRFSVLKDYTAPISLLVGPGPAGGWLIFEELSVSRP